MMLNSSHETYMTAPMPMYQAKLTRWPGLAAPTASANCGSVSRKKVSAFWVKVKCSMKLPSAAE